LSRGDLLRVAIIGTGNIGSDLLFKVRRSKNLKCTLMVGRRSDSPGLSKASQMGIQTSSGGLKGLLENIDKIDLVFDATSAAEHIKIAAALKSESVALVNLTPAPLGDFYIPLVTKKSHLLHLKSHLNMVTCGGQTSIPLVHAVTNKQNIDSVEVVSTISSKSAGIATRQNLDEYIHNTERAIVSETGVRNVKVMLVLNPAIPEIVMHTSIYISSPELNLDEVTKVINKRVSEMQRCNQNLKIKSAPFFTQSGTIHFSVEVFGSGDFLPKYAGNLDIMNVAAIQAAEEIAFK
jgi:acetaldehyde dehydrogenase (acetylating)